MSQMSGPKVLLRSSQVGSEGHFRIEGVVAQWCIPLTFPARPVRRSGFDMYKGSRTGLALASSAIPALGTKNPASPLPSGSLIGTQSN